MKKFLFLFMGLLLSSLGAFAQSTTIEATPIESLSTYTGTEPYVFDMSARKYYAYNNLNQYEEMGIYPEVSTLKVAGGGVTEIEYIATNATMGTKPYINTGYVHKANTRIVMECDIDASDTKNYQAPFGSRSGYGANMFVFFWRFGGNNKGCFARNAEVVGAEGVNVPTGEKIKVDASGVSLNVYKENESTPCVTITGEGAPQAGTTPMYIFDLCHVDHADGSATLMKLYSFKIYEGETLVMDLVPIVDGEGNGGLKDKLTGTVYTSANSSNFALSPDGEEAASGAGISVYPGKLVINTSDNHEYKWDGTQWVDLGSVFQPISDTNYQNMNNWTCRFGYEDTFGHIVNSDGNDNFFNPYNGKGDWEPYQCRINDLTKGEDYRVSFKFTSQGWNSWSSYSTLPFFVTNNWNFGRGNVPNGVGGDVLGYVGLPQAILNNQPYSFTFTADDENVLAIQFGVGDDYKDFYFHFDDLLIELADYPEKYDLTWVDPNKYTPLEYIESTSAAQNNPYTLPYNPKTSTQIEIEFNAYESSGWQAIFCARNQFAGTGISLYKNGDNAHFGYFTGGTTGAGDNFAPFSFNTDYHVIADVTNLKLNGTDYATGNTTTNATTRNLSLFANPEWDNPFRGRIYYCNISENGEAVYNFNPVMRHDGVFGYYDAATATFVIPAQGHLTGYGYKKIDDLAYMTYSPETRLVLVGNTAKYLPDVQNLDGATFTWSTADPSIATVAPDGTVTGVSGGKVMITVSTDADEGWTASYELTVSEPNYVRHDVNNVGYAVVTGGNGWGDSPVSGLVDNDARTKFGCSGTGDSWAIMIASEPVAVSQYSFVTGADTYNNPGRTPRSWKLEGSNDNQNWTVIDEQVQNYKAKTSNMEETVFPVNDTETYKFFKFTATAFDGGFQLGEFWINEQAHNWGEYTETPATCIKEGTEKWECSDCHAVKTEVLPLEAHNFAGGACSVCNQTVDNITLLPNGQANPYTVKFRHKLGSENDPNIEDGWNGCNFDDSEWDDMLMPLGIGDNVHHTRWLFDYNTFWFRRTFVLDDPDMVAQLKINLNHDDDYKLYVNGTLVKEETGWDPVTIEIPTDLLVLGLNVIALYIEQNWGGAYCDFDLVGSLQLSLDENIEGNIDKISAFEGATMPVVLHRPLVSGTYNTIILPFDMSADEIATAFGEGTTIASLASYDAEKNNYSFQTATDIQAGVAYLIKPTADGSHIYNFTGRTIDAAIDDASLFVGSYDPQELQLGDKIVAAGNKVKSLVEAGRIKGFRAYFPADSGSGAKSATFSVDGESTGIIGIDGEIIETTGNIYDLQGRKVNKPQHGVYIVNGKKVVVK